MSLRRVIGRTLAAALILLAPAGLGCGGGSGTGVTCGQTQPCGGDLVGSWTIVDGCVDPLIPASEVMAPIGSCPSVTVDSISASQSGMFTFAADLSFTGSASMSRSYTTTIPESCLAGMTCAQLETELTLRGGTHSCSGESSCTCTSDHRSSVNGPGQYMIFNDRDLAVFAGNAAMNGWGFCVTGSTLHLSQSSLSRVYEDIVLTRVTR